MGDWKDLNEYRECEDETVQQARNKEEIDRLRANEGSLCEKIRALTDENKRLRANQIPGRCGECGHFEGRDEVSHGVCGYLKCKTEGCTKLYVQWMKNKKDFCNEWKPKE